MPEYGICTPIGAITESADLGQFEAVTGLPLHLGLLHQSLIATCVVGTMGPQLADGRAAPTLFVLPESIDSYWTAWLDCIEPGSRVPDLFATTVAGILADLLAPDHALAPLPENVRAQVANVQALFELEADGQAVGDTRWTLVRRQCSAMTDVLAAGTAGAVTDDGCVVPIAQLLESLCWSWAGDYGEPLGALEGFASVAEAWMVARLEDPAHRAVKEQASAAMRALVARLRTEPALDLRSLMQSDPVIQAANSPEFSAASAALHLRVTPQVGGRMMAVLLDRIKTSQTR